MQYRVLYALLLFLVISCSKEENITANSNDDIPQNSNGVTFIIPIDNNTENNTTKSHWDNNGIFGWDATTQGDADMVTFVSSSANNSFAQWESGLLYNYTKVEVNTDAKKASLTPRGTLKMNSVAVGNNVFCISPLNTINGAIVVAKNNEINTTLYMPSVFENTNSLENLKDFSYIYTSTSIKNTNNGTKTIETHGAKFKAVPAILKLQLNNDNIAKYIKKVVIKATNANGSSASIFPDKLLLTSNMQDIKLSEFENKSNYRDSVMVKIEEELGKSESKNYFALVFPVTSENYKNTNLTISITVQTGITSEVYTIEKKNFAEKITNNAIISGGIYTMTLDIANNNKKLLGNMPVYDYVLDKLQKGEMEIDVEAYKMDYNTIGGVFASITDKYHEFEHYKFLFSHDENSITRLVTCQIYWSEERINTFKSEIKKGLSQITSDMTDLEKIITVHSWICKDVAYNNKAFTAGMVAKAEIAKLAASVVDKKTNCYGYSKTFAYYMRLLGIECDIVIGYRGGYHAWNKVKLNNKWYIVDLTNDDYIGPVSHNNLLNNGTISQFTPSTPSDHENMAEDTYKTAFWKNVYGDIVIINHIAYFATNNIIYSHSVKENELSGNSNDFYNSSYTNCSISGYQGVLYFTKSNGIYMLNLETKEPTLIKQCSYPQCLRVANGVVTYLVNGKEESFVLADEYNY